MKHTMNTKAYEQSNHLGNVLVAVSDARQILNSGSSVTGFVAIVKSATDYSAFGAPMAGRTYTSNSYRYSFNGKEKENEIASGDLDFGARICDARLGRWLSMDNYSSAYPDLSPFSFSGNVPTYIIDAGGNYLIDPNGDIIYTVQPSKPSERVEVLGGGGSYQFKMYVWIYANDGTPHEAIILKYYDSEGKEMQQPERTYDCHGLTQANGAFWINSNSDGPAAGPDPIQGMMEADRGGTMKEFTGEENAKEGDIIIFRDANGYISHTAIYNGDGTYRTKNGRNPEEARWNLEQLQAAYPGTQISYTQAAPNTKIAITGGFENTNGTAMYTVDQVTTAYANAVVNTFQGGTGNPTTATTTAAPNNQSAPAPTATGAGVAPASAGGTGATAPAPAPAGGFIQGTKCDGL